MNGRAIQCGVRKVQAGHCSRCGRCLACTCPTADGHSGTCGALNMKTLTVCRGLIESGVAPCILATEELHAETTK